MQVKIIDLIKQGDFIRLNTTKEGMVNDFCPSDVDSNSFNAVELSDNRCLSQLNCVECWNQIVQVDID